MLAIAHKVVSKAEGRIVDVAAVEPTAEAERLAAEHGKDARHVQVILDESAEVLRADRGRIICRTRHGFVCANAGVDASNAGAPGRLVLLPADPDASARALRRSLGCAVLITDSFGRPWRVGQAEVAIGCAGLAPADDWRGRDDADGRELAATVIAVADEAAAAADLVRGKDTREPAIRIRGLERYVTSDDGAGAAALVRALADDLFPLGRPLGRQPRVEPVARLLDALAVRERPRAERLQRRRHRGAERRERVLHPRRHLGVHAARHDAVALHAAQRLREHLLGDRLEILQQLVVTARAVAERQQDVDRPLRAQQRDRVADQSRGARALRYAALVGAWHRGDRVGCHQPPLVALKPERS